jgi:hypothetical protein
MGRTNPNKPSKSPNKRIEEQDKQDPLINVTPQPATARKNTTETEQSESPQTKSYRAHTQIQDIYKNDISMINHMEKMDRERKLKGEPALYRDDDSLRTMDKIEHVHNQEDNMSKPEWYNNHLPHKMTTSWQHKTRMQALRTRRLNKKSNTGNETTQRWRKCLLP